MPTNVRETGRLTKTAVNKLLVNERKSMREKQKQSAFMRKTLNVYNAMERRAEEMGDMPQLPFSLASFRQWWSEQQTCHYCGAYLRLAITTADHSYPVGRDDSTSANWELDNLRACCRSCNWQKGMLDIEQFKSLRCWINEHLKEPEKSDFKRRLTIGGKWGVRV